MFHKVKTVCPLPDYELSVQFAEGLTKLYDVKPLFKKWKDSFFNTNILTIYVPQSAVDAYKAADGWSQYADIIVGDEE